MDDNYVTLRDLMAICREAPEDARIMIRDYLPEGFEYDDDTWTPMTSYEYTDGDDGLPVFFAYTIVGYPVLARDINEDKSMREYAPDCPVQAEWGMNGIMTLKEIWYNEYKNEICLDFLEGLQ